VSGSATEAAMLALLKRDLALATRAGGGFGLALAFFLILCAMVPFGVGPDSSALSPIAPGILWVGALLSCLLSLDRIFALDHEDGSLDLLATAPVPLEGVVAIKALAHWITTGLPLVAVAPLFGILLHLPGDAMPTLILSLLIGTPALSVLGAFGAAITVGLRRGGLLLSLLVLPLYIPTLIFGTEIIRRSAEGGSIATPVLFLAGITAGVLALVPFAAAGALRVNLR
jgi:heme exporter protein B